LTSGASQAAAPATHRDEIITQRDADFQLDRPIKRAPLLPINAFPWRCHLFSGV
jgi:hypothetical protein